MNLDRINKWLALGANIGVVVGLAILILEMRQNASLSRTAIEVQKNALFAQIELSIASSDTATVWMKSVFHPEELTDSEIRILDGILASATLQWDYTFQMEAAGLIDKRRVASHLKNSAPYYFGSTFGKNWYNQQAIGWADTIMSEIADPIISIARENLAKMIEKVVSDRYYITGRSLCWLQQRICGRAGKTKALQIQGKKLFFSHDHRKDSSNRKIEF